jgi:hypothetical protein
MGRGRLVVGGLIVLGLGTVGVLVLRNGDGEKESSGGVVAGTMSSTPASRPSSFRSESRVISNVVPLGWGRGRENTFAGALESALAVTEHPADYVDIMGGTGLSFRSRWFKGEWPERWHRSSAIGEIPLPDQGVKDSTGWDIGMMRWPQRPEDPEAFVPLLVRSINEGKPVLGFDRGMDVAVLYGYEDFGKAFWTKGYFTGDGGERVGAGDLHAYFILLSTWTPPLDDRRAFLEGLKTAVRDWRRGEGGLGEKWRYWYGAKAYEQWLADLGQMERFDEQEKAQFFAAHWWNFNCLDDARRAGVRYLQRHGPTLNVDAKLAVDRAVELYTKAAQITGRPIKQKDLFLGPWTGKTVKDWTADVYGREIGVLEELRKLDGEAVKALEAALASEGVELER